MAKRDAELAIDVSSTLKRNPVSLERARGAAAKTLASEKVRSAMVSVTFVSRPAIARINRSYLGKSGATDVIAFGFDRDAEDAMVIGDIYICPDVARANAREAGVPLPEEVLRLVVHGTLHILAYDHDEGESRTRSAMWKRQERILSSVL